MSDLTRSKLVLLLTRLLEGTQKRILTWSMLTDWSFAYSSTNATVIVESKDQDGRLPFVVRVLDDAGTEVDSDESHWRDASSYETNGEIGELIQDLYEAARSNALNVDPILDSLLQDVNQKIGYSE